MTDNNELQVADGPSGLLHESRMAVDLGGAFGLAPKQVINVLRNSIIKVPRNSPPPTPAELVVVMSVMQKHGLDPMLKQLHAWRDGRGELAVMLGYDGWVEIAMRHRSYNGVSYECGPLIASPDKKGKQCFEYIKVTVHDKVRGSMAQMPTYLEEWYVNQRYEKPEPWQKQTKHKLKVVAFRLAIRECYGVSGIDVRDVEDVMHEPMGGASLEDKAMEAIGVVDGTEVYQDEPVEAETTDDDGVDTVPCGVKGCPSDNSVGCSACGAYYCEDHLSHGECQICRGE